MVHQLLLPTSIMSDSLICHLQWSAHLAEIFKESRECCIMRESSITEMQRDRSSEGICGVSMWDMWVWMVDTPWSLRSINHQCQAYVMFGVAFTSSLNKAHMQIYHNPSSHQIPLYDSHTQPSTHDLWLSHLTKSHRVITDSSTQVMADSSTQDT